MPALVRRQSSLSKSSSIARIVGIDPSLNSTGYAYRFDGVLRTGVVQPKDLRGAFRLTSVRNAIRKVLDIAQPQLVVYEGYAMGARGNNMFNLGELGGVLHVEIWERGIDMLEVPPTTMKSVIAMNGRADKQQVIDALKRRFDLRIPQHDEADAVGLMLVGEMRKGAWRTQYEELDSARRKALNTCKIHTGQLKSIAIRAN